MRVAFVKKKKKKNDKKNDKKWHKLVKELNKIQNFFLVQIRVSILLIIGKKWGFLYLNIKVL
jgi:hypothetical protein